MVSNPNVRRITSAVAGFILGLAASLLLWFVFGVVSSFFRGPIAGWNELGGPIYVNDQTTLGIVTGLSYFVTAFLGAYALRRKVSRAFKVGLATGTTILGASILVGM